MWGEDLRVVSSPQHNRNGVELEGVEGLLGDIVFADGVLEADVEAVLLVYHMEARVLMILDCKR